MEERFNVVEVQIAPPHARRVMAEDQTLDNAEAIVRMAIMRRGVEGHFYVAEPLPPTKDEGE